MKSVALAICLLAISAGCHDDNTVTGPDCSNVAGSYLASWNNSCGGAGSDIPVVVAQAGCNVNLQIVGLGSASGSLNGNNFTFTLNTACGGVSGSGTVSSTAVNGTFNGTSPGGSNCCPAGPVSGSFTLRR